VLDAAEVANAQRREPEPRRPFEVVESVPARPPRAPKIPSDFSTLPAEKTPTEKTPAEKTPAAVNHRESPRARFTHIGGLLLMALVVFALTFGITKALRDERSLPRAKKALVEGYDRAAARVEAWFGATPKEPETNATTSVAPSRPKAAPPASLLPAPEPSESAPPVVRLEDLKPLESSSAAPAKPRAPVPTRR
jgi:hypothetical protein